MNELNKTNRLTIAVSIIVLIILIGLITFQKPDVSYKLSPAESLKLLSDTTLMVTPSQAEGMLKDSSGKIVFVDVRNSIEFVQGHFKNAINIPVRDLFAKEGKKSFRDLEKAGQIAVLYGETQQQANGPWLMLRQTGFKNVKLFTGNYAQLQPAEKDTLIGKLPQLSESPLIDTAALKAISAPASNSTAQKNDVPKKTVTTTKKSGSSGGGC
jgi:rhodanese-related sulfurtransferase